MSYNIRRKGDCSSLNSLMNLDRQVLEQLDNIDSTCMRIQIPENLTNEKWAEKQCLRLNTRANLSKDSIHIFRFIADMTIPKYTFVSPFPARISPSFPFTSRSPTWPANILHIIFLITFCTSAGLSSKSSDRIIVLFSAVLFIIIPFVVKLSIFVHASSNYTEFTISLLIMHTWHQYTACRCCCCPSIC